MYGEEWVRYNDLHRLSSREHRYTHGGKSLKLFLIISQIVYGLFLTLWFTFWAMSAMLFDAGVNRSAVVVFGVISAYPIAATACSIIAWVLYRKRHRNPALVVNLIPSLWVIGILVALIFTEVQTA